MLSANDKPSTTSNALNSNIFGAYSKENPLSAKAYYRMDSKERHDMDSSKSLQHIWIVTGPAGSGKTTVAKNLQSEMGLPFLEGDDVRFCFFFFLVQKERLSFTVLINYCLSPYSFTLHQTKRKWLLATP